MVLAVRADTFVQLVTLAFFLVDLSSGKYPIALI